jgi:hypothetical protein
MNADEGYARRTPGKTLAMSWLPVADSARSTIIGLRALWKCHQRGWLERQRQMSGLPFCWLAHPFDDPS